MSQLILFDVPSPDSEKLRATIDLCLFDDGVKAALPEDMLERYQRTTGPETNGVPWTKQIQSAHAAIAKFDKALSKTRKDVSLFGNYKTPKDQAEVLEAVDELVTCEKDLEGSKSVWDPEIFVMSKKAFDRLKDETPIELTRNEKAVIAKLPRSPSFEDKRTIQSALTKLMLQARYHPDQRVRQEKEAQVQALINVMGCSIEYQSVIDALRSHRVVNYSSLKGEACS